MWFTWLLAGACAAMLQLCVQHACATWAHVVWHAAFAALGVAAAASPSTSTSERHRRRRSDWSRACVLAACIAAACLCASVCGVAAACLLLAACASAPLLRVRVVLCACALLACVTTCTCAPRVAAHVCAVCGVCASARVYASLTRDSDAATPSCRDALRACALLACVSLPSLVLHTLTHDTTSAARQTMHTLAIVYASPCIVFACAVALARACASSSSLMRVGRGVASDALAACIGHAVTAMVLSVSRADARLALDVATCGAAVALLRRARARTASATTLPRNGRGDGGDDTGKRATLCEAWRMLRGNARLSRLALFLGLTLLVMLLELAYGVHANSLGLVSDAFHMLMDAASLAVGLCAAYATSWPADARTHPLGYARYELLGGFVNGVLLICIAVCILRESLERVYDPPAVDGDYLLAVSVIGLLVNIVGVCCFHGAQCGGGGGACSHSHGDGGGGAVDHNMRGVYLHVLADLLGSVSVIVSSVCVRYAGWWVSDPLCSAFSSTLILLSALPLLVETGKLLLLASPSAAAQRTLHATLVGADGCGDVADVEALLCWQHATTPHAALVCAVRGRLLRDADYDATRQRVHDTLHRAVAAQLHDPAATVNCTVHLE